jgi:uncharacterized protein YkwD
MGCLGAVLSAVAVLGPGARGVSSAEAARAGETCRGAQLAPSASDSATIARATLCLVNEQRMLHHLAPLRSSAPLTRIAAAQSWDMVNGNYFADHSLGGRSPKQRIVPALRPAHVATTGQNIGWGTGSEATPAGIVRSWMNSPPHREIILTRAFREAGVGMAPRLPEVLARGAQGATYALELSARKR